MIAQELRDEWVGWQRGGAAGGGGGGGGRGEGEGWEVWLVRARAARHMACQLIASEIAILDRAAELARLSEDADEGVDVEGAEGARGGAPWPSF
jgi:hypothetical protein